MDFPDDRLYSKEGFWVRIEGDTATIGISDWLQDQLGALISMYYNEYSKDILTIESSSGNTPFPKPLAGEPITDGFNNEALVAPFNINSNPYGQDNWLYKMTIAKSAATGLMTAAQFRTLVGQ